MTDQRLRELYDAVFDPDSDHPDYDAAYIALSDGVIRALPALLYVIEEARVVVQWVQAVVEEGVPPMLGAELSSLEDALFNLDDLDHAEPDE